MVLCLDVFKGEQGVNRFCSDRRTEIVTLAEVAFEFEQECKLRLTLLIPNTRFILLSEIPVLGARWLNWIKLSLQWTVRFESSVLK